MWSHLHDFYLSQHLTSNQILIFGQLEGKNKMCLEAQESHLVLTDQGAESVCRFRQSNGRETGHKFLNGGRIGMWAPLFLGRLRHERLHVTSNQMVGQ